MNSQDFEIDVALADGVYVYDAEQNLRGRCCRRRTCKIGEPPLPTPRRSFSTF